ncbi:hypothetical protein SteCoe_11411 [Stentor coeruleus]|uniref:Peptidylprolyl isomerase n=1 Tax=Stentor coeruleus TaxID=5963 RepID=A0A1R2CD66_9CILI|nr:hypothetical protein SteCoe_11411 [Stentor coeruleus]
MAFFDTPYLREERYFDSNVLKRVIKEGTGCLLAQNCKVTMLEEIYIETSSSFLSLNPQKTYKIISYPEGSLITNYDNILMTMKVGEEAWVKFPYMYHSVSEASWDTIWYHFAIESADFTPDLLSLPQFMPFLREHKIVKGPGVIKRVVEEGIGKTANVTAKVVYNYEIVLENGCVVETLMAKNYLLTRNISPGMHSGIHLSLYTMRAREKSFIRLPPGYHALQKFSSNTLWAQVLIENIIFPNDLVFPQTLPYLEEIDLKDNYLIKRIVKKGSGPLMQGMIKVWIILEGRLEDGYHFQKPKEEIVLLNGGKIYSEALITGINSMQRGEISWIKAPPEYHIYKDGYENETLWMLVNVKEYFESFPKLNSKMTIDEKLDEGFKQLEIAKRLYSSNTKRECKTIYNDIITILKLKKDGFAELSEVNKIKFIDVKGRAMMNLALMLINL